MAQRKTDKQTLAQLIKESPEVLEREVDFDALVVKVIIADSDCAGSTSKLRKQSRRVKRGAARPS